MKTKKSIDKCEDFKAFTLENDFIFSVNDIKKT